MAFCEARLYWTSEEFLSLKYIPCDFLCPFWLSWALVWVSSCLDHCRSPCVAAHSLSQQRDLITIFPLLLLETFDWLLIPWRLKFISVLCSSCLFSPSWSVNPEISPYRSAHCCSATFLLDLCSNCLSISSFLSYNLSDPFV